MTALWPHQPRTAIEVQKAVAAGERRICVCGPTGCGKTKIAELLIDEWLREGHYVAMLTNRKMLVSQTAGVMEAAGFEPGIRASGYASDLEARLQITSVQTEHARVTKGGQWGLHPAKRVIVDEAHIQTGKTVQTLLDAYLEQGAVIVGLTATPLDIGNIYDHLIVAATMRELRECGALVQAHHYGCDEPDLKAFKKLRDGQDPSESQQKLAIMTPSIMGRVWKWYQEINEERRPTILFGPGVEESLWFAEQFERKGVPAAHIDGENVWLGGKFYRNARNARDDVREASKEGRVKVVANRYVLREGVDWPWISHVILAFVAGDLRTYLQTVGRGLRACEGKECLTIQDHGGAWWRHGSVNADREWNLEYTSEIAYGLRVERIRSKKCRRCKAKLNPGSVWCPRCSFCNEIEPRRCPECSRIVTGYRCLCGWEGKPGMKSRPVVSTDGELREMTGDIIKPRRLYKHPDGPKLWERMYWRSRTEKGARTFRAAAALFAQENRWGWPDETWPMMPTETLDWFRLVSDVPMERLTPK